MALLAALLLDVGARMPEAPDQGTNSDFSLTLGATTALEQALEKAMHRDPDSMVTLQRAAEACAAELREKGAPPERMLIAMKALIRRTAASHPPPGNQASSWAADGYIEKIVRWSIAEYYRANV